MNNFFSHNFYPLLLRGIITHPMGSKWCDIKQKKREPKLYRLLRFSTTVHNNKVKPTQTRERYNFTTCCAFALWKFQKTRKVIRFQLYHKKRTF